MEQKKLGDLIKALHETTGGSVMVLAPDRAEIVTYPDEPEAFYRLLQNTRQEPGCMQTQLRDLLPIGAELDAKPLRQKITAYISDNLSADLSVQALCRRFAVSKSELYRLLRSRAPQGIANYVRTLRFQRACDLLRHTRKPLWEIAAEVGYDNPDYFLRAFKRYVGISAGKYRKEAE
ncbi:MAG: helix-turn-helix transcriptional regulator [Oscillospiraceae bacterium]|nr:helix-turn-helix transcriptional regulator [Oscillospiraceae bacterium]